MSNNAQDLQEFEKWIKYLGVDPSIMLAYQLSRIADAIEDLEETLASKL